MGGADQLFREAVAAQQAGRLTEAVAGYQRVLKENPRHFQAMNNLGLALHAAGRPADAVQCYEKLLGMEENPNARSNLGNALRDLGRKADAVEQYRRALEMKSEDAELQCNLGVALAELGQLQEGVAHLERAIALAPGRAHFHNNLGNARQGQGRLRDAVAHYRKAIDLNPDYAEAHNNLAAALLALGKPEEAADHFQEAVKRRPWLGGAQRQLARLRPDALDVAGIGKLLETPGLYKAHRVELHFALGEVYRARDDVDRAFAHYAEGNRLRNESMAYDPAAHARGVDALIKLCNAEFFHQRRDFGVESSLPVFIIGMPRSGTSLVEQILASHRDIHGSGEGPWVPGMVRHLAGSADPAACAKVLRGLDKAGSRIMGQEYLSRVQRVLPDGAHPRQVTDKLPDNFLRVGLIRLMLPGARFIHCMRDARDTCLSLFIQSFVGLHPYAWDLGNIGAYYRQYERLMDHWRQVLPEGVMLEVRYEDLVADLEPVARRMIEFLGLQWDPACLAFYRTERIVTSASNTDVRKPIFSDAVGRWRAYEKHLGPLFAALEP